MQSEGNPGVNAQNLNVVEQLVAQHTVKIADEVERGINYLPVPVVATCRHYVTLDTRAVF